MMSSRSRLEFATRVLVLYQALDPIARFQSEAEMN